MPPTDIYQAIEKGTLDGALGNPSFALGYKWDEVTKYYNPLSFGGLGQFVAMNKNSWEKLPPDVQKRTTAIHDVACGAAHEIYQGGGEVLLQNAIAQGKTVVTQPSREDMTKIEEVTRAKIAADWVAKLNKRDAPAQKVLDRWLELLAKWHGAKPL
jgi:TRAP-type C4-dicarboxylate transport system substrate-binding protein